MKKAFLILTAFLAAFVLFVTFGPKAKVAAESYGFSDALSNGRVKETHTLELEVKDGQPTSTRALYSQKVNLTNPFEFNFKIDNLCKDGGFRFTFVSTKDDYPMENYGDGFGIYFWDETAWGHTEHTWLRSDFMRYSKAGLKAQDAKRVFAADQDYIGKEMYIKVWNFDENNYAIQIDVDGTTPAIGTVLKADLGAFDPTNCLFMITPEIDSSRAHSYESNVKLTLDLKGGFADALNNGRVNDARIVDLEVKDGQPTSTRAYMEEHININNVFECMLSINNLCKDGGFRLTLLSSKDDYPMENYGDGFGIYFWDETAWGHTEHTWLRSDFMRYSKAGLKTQEAKRVFSADTDYIGKEMYIKIWNFDENNYAIQINADGTKDMGTAVAVGTVAKADLGAFNPTNCVLMLTPEIDSSRAHSYESNVVLTMRDVKGAGTYFNTSITDNGHVTASLSCGSVVAKGENVVISATPEEGYQIKSVTVNGTPVELTDGKFTINNLQEDLTVVVETEAIPTFTITITDTTNGTITSTKEGTQYVNTEVTFDVQANEGYYVKSFKVNDVEKELTNGKYTLTLTENVTVSAEFELIPASTYTVSLTNENEDMGTLSANHTGVVEENTEVVFTVTPNAGYKVVSFKVNDVEKELTNGTFTLTLTENVTAVVVFDHIYHTVTVSDTEHGTVTASHTGSVAENTEVTVEVKAEAWYQVKSFKVNGVETELTEGKYVVVLTEDLTITAEFEKTPAQEDTSEFKDALGNDRVIYEKKDNVHIIELENKDGQSSNTRAYYSDNIDITKVFEAYLTIKDICKDGAFRLSFLSSKGDYPMEGYGDGFGIYFWDETAWGHNENTWLRCDYMRYSKASGGSMDAKRVFGANDNYIGKTMYIKVWDFDANNYAIQINIDGTKDMSTAAAVGTVAKANLGAFDPTNCVLMITPEIDSSRPHSHERNVQLEMFNIQGKGEYVEVTKTITGQGTVELSVDGVAAVGSNVTVTVEAKAGWELSKLLVNDTKVQVDETGKYVIENVQNDISIVAEFTELEVPVTIYTVTVTQDEKGTITASKTGEVIEGTTITISAKANKGFFFKSIKVNGEAVELTDGVATITVNENVTITAEFTPYSIGEGSRFNDALENNRVNAVEEDGSTTLTFVTTDSSTKTQSRAIYKEKVSLNEIEFYFTINRFNADGALRISFLTQATDYPMEGSGEGFCIYFWDETAWGHPALTSLRADLYAYGYGTTDKTLIKEDRAISNGDIVGTTFKVRIVDFSDETLGVLIFIGDTQVAGGEVSKILLPKTFNWNDCYMIVTPEIDDNRAHSYDEDVQITFGSVTFVKGEDPVNPDQPDQPGEEEEFSITYKSGDTVLRVAYAEKGEEFPEFEAPEVSGYKFDGWYLDKDFTTKFTDKTASKDIEVYAKYSKIEEDRPITQAPSDNTPSKTGKKKGCKNALVPSILGITLVFSSIVVIRQKKRREE